MRFIRSAGTLLHPTSLPGTYGIGDFGSSSRQFLNFLKESGQSIWQMLPLTPTGYGYSPYASYSAFAGNIYLISPELLLEKGLVTAQECEVAKLPSKTYVDYEKVQANKDVLFKKAFERFKTSGGLETQAALQQFMARQKYWLQDYALFAACFHAYGKKPWNKWPKEIASRTGAGIKKAQKELSEEIEYHMWIQFEFYNQWTALKKDANSLGIRLLGDIPIFVDHNSADVWANPNYFEVDANGNRVLVAGVPPDYFSETGQLWGNPQYNWEAMENDDYKWWVERFNHMFSMYDAIRVDHFRGFEAYWQVKAGEKTAVNGEWVKGPGTRLFDSILKQCGELPIIAEDLGVITPEVEALRDRYDFPGMKIIQFAFDSDSRNSFLPHNYSQNCVTYSGTHDNDTSRGWYEAAPEKEKHAARIYCKSDGVEIHWDFIRLGMYSVADQAIFPMQDYLGLDTKHRMNFPGTVANNWSWRLTPAMMEEVDKIRIRTLIEQTNRAVI